MFSGTLPSTLTALTALVELRVHRNGWSGPVPDVGSALPALANCQLYSQYDVDNGDPHWGVSEWSCYECPLPTVTQQHCVSPVLQGSDDPCILSRNGTGKNV